MANKKHAIHDLAARTKALEELTSDLKDWCRNLSYRVSDVEESDEVISDTSSLTIATSESYRENIGRVEAALSTLRLRIARMEDQRRRNASWVLIVLVISVVALIVRSGL